MDTQQIIEKFELVPLPNEGGYFKEIYKSNEIFILKNERNSEYKRSFYTHIFYLITPTNYSRFHRIRSDELFHFYYGDAVEQLLIYPNGEIKSIILGNDILKNEIPVNLVPKNVWQGSRLVDGGKVALLGTTVVPGFEYDDYEHGDLNKLLKLFPDLSKHINFIKKD